MRMQSRAKKRGSKFPRCSVRVRVLFFRTTSSVRFSLGSGFSDLQMRQPEQVVRRAPQVGHLLDFPAAQVPHFAQSARLLQPAEDLLDLLARLLADPIAERFHPPPHSSS